MRLLGVGKHRFNTLKEAARDGREDAPLDGRYIPKGPQDPSEKRAKVFDFLAQLYKTAGECLPDGSNVAVSNKRPRQGKYRLDEKQMDRSGLRYLPPGKIMDYVRLCRASLPSEKISRKLFDSVWMEHFTDKLRIRASTHHSKCSVCVRHRLIIKRVGRGPARLAQLQQYQAHLRRQYKDRQQYWEHRATSRLQASSGEPVTQVSMICDSMDQGKHCYPRSESMQSKEFNTWSRPKLQSTTIICHGHAVLVGLSPTHVPGNSSRTAELLSYMMTKCVSLSINWSNCFLHMEADNCAKEIKNQTCLRLLAALIGQYKLAGSQLSFLSSGHSHEDVDAHFAVVSSYLESHRELWTVDDFQQCLQDLFNDPKVRQHEGSREVVVFDQYRDWSFECIM